MSLLFAFVIQRVPRLFSAEGDFLTQCDAAHLMQAGDLNLPMFTMLNTIGATRGQEGAWKAPIVLRWHL